MGAADPCAWAATGHTSLREITKDDVLDALPAAPTERARRPDVAVGYRWVKFAIGKGLTGTQIREDRILNEAHATGGDMRALVDLFGLSTNASSRYLRTVDPPGLIHSNARRPSMIANSPAQHVCHRHHRLPNPGTQTHIDPAKVTRCCRKNT